MKRMLIVALTLVLACNAQEGKSEGEKTDKEKAAKDREASKIVNGKDPLVVIDTSLGKIEVELFENKAPITVKNFLKYVDDGFYNGTIFHRVIPDFMIQGGGFEPGLEQKETRGPIKNESDNGLENKRGTLAMARTPAPNSATAQFFINLKHNDFLDRANAQDGVGYAVFGKVIKGMDVVDEIAKVETGRKAGQKDVPVKDVVIKSIKRIKDKDKEKDKDK